MQIIVGCELSQIAKGGSKDAEFALLSINDETIGAMKFSDTKFNSEPIEHNRATAFLSGTASSASIHHNATESGFGARIVGIYSDKPTTDYMDKYGSAGARYNQDLFSNKQESEMLEARLVNIFYQVVHNHLIYEDENNEQRRMNGYEYYYDKSVLFDDKLKWRKSEAARRGVLPSDVSMADYTPPSGFINPETGMWSFDDVD